jgi:peptidoglycan/xylan/chitin deacetylase (PgdA/CDA1 family)
VRIRSLIIAAIALGVCAASALGKTAPTAVGLAGVQSASLQQNARSLDWTVTFVHGISARGISSSSRRVCLELAKPHGSGVEEEVCLSSAAKHGPRLGLTQTSWHGSVVGGTRPLAGTVTRSNQGHTITASFTPTALGLPYRSVRWQVRSEARGRQCPSTRINGRTERLCALDFPAHHAPLTKLHTPQLVGCVPAGSSLVYNGPTSKREIALSFDDGPWSDPPTIDFVNELGKLGVTGTFFEIGEQIPEFDPTGAVERAMLADGDMIGNHTWTHPQMTTLSPAQQTSELEQTNEAIHHATGFTPCLWRPPYGDTSPALESLARSLGMLTVMWNIDPRDWALPGTGSIVATVLKEAQNGGITEMHFGGGPREETLDALPQMVADLRARGYHFVNLVQMLGLREVWR